MTLTGLFRLLFSRGTRATPQLSALVAPLRPFDATGEPEIFELASGWFLARRPGAAFFGYSRDEVLERDARWCRELRRARSTGFQQQATGLAGGNSHGEKQCSF